MALINSDVIPASATAYQIEQSLKFNDDDSPYLSRTPSSAGNRKTWTWSGWVKRGNLSIDFPRILHLNNVTLDFNILFLSDDTIRIQAYTSGSQDFRLITNDKYRDSSAWYHIIFVFDTSNSTSSDRARLYVNGNRVTSFSTENYPSLNYEGPINTTNTHYFSYYNGSEQFFDGYLAEVNFIDGQALDPTSFGKTGTYGEWKPIKYTGTYGTNGFYLPFKQDYEVEGFSTVTWKGNSSDGHYIGGTGFKPSLIWIKEKSSTSEHRLFDRVRGESRRIVSNNTNAETYDASNLQTFANDGFTLGNSGSVNASTDTYVAWNWDMGADTPTGFSSVIYTGNGSTQHIGGVGFQPDFVWTKSRSSAHGHGLYDSVRGATKRLVAHATIVEDTQLTAVTSFDTDGFTAGGQDGTNANGDTYVAWCWDMGGSTVTNTDGDITSTVRANTTYGQSIVSYTGNGTSNSTVGHGLNSAPEMVILKCRTQAEHWAVWHKDLSSNKQVYLNLGNAEEASQFRNTDNYTTTWADGFELGSNIMVNQSGDNYVAYCFHSVSGYSKFGGYTGNGGSSDITITLGFRPAFIMFKRIDSANSWVIYDSTRQPITNDLNSNLYANLSNAEATNNDWGVITDTGFILQDDIGVANENGGSYIYMAFAGGQDSISDFNTDGSINARVKANPTYGQSIVSYTGNGTAGATYGHGLSSTPELIITKSRGTADWLVYDDINGATKYLQLNTTNPSQTGAGAWNNTAPTSSVVTIGFAGTSNASGSNYISYCFHSVSGYSKFGSYSGNASSNSITGLGFAPAWVMIKRTDSTAGWVIFDIVRNTAYPLLPNSSVAEDTLFNSWESFDSDGFTLNGANGEVNASGGTYIYMAFADTREFAYWLDQSGNNNDWTSNNLTESDVMLDSPTNNFAVCEGLQNRTTYGMPTLSEGNLKFSNTGITTSWGYRASNIEMTSGKWYAEYHVSGNTNAMIGVFNTGYYGESHFLDQNPQDNTGSFVMYHDGATATYFKYNGGTQVANSIDEWNDGDIVGIAVDVDAGTAKFYINGSLQTGITTNGVVDISAGTGDAYRFWALTPDSSASVFIANFGQDSSFAGNKVAQGNTDDNNIGDFYYTPPSGYLALCTANLSDPAVIPSEHFNTVLWTGNGSSSRSITGVGFQPDFVWEKSRSDADQHNLVDAVRGTTKILYSALENTEVTDTDRLLSFDSDGFTIGSDLSWNDSTPHNYVAWSWKGANGTSSNTNGSITSTVSANVDAGFSIVSYTGNGTAGATVGHGLSSAPEMVIVKTRDNSYGWVVGQFQLNNTKALYLNLNIAFDTNNYWNSTNPSSTVFTLGTAASNINGNNMIAYCFHSVDGFSKVGSYTGNGSTDGTFVYTGFRPAFVMVKSTTSSHDWVMLDATRSDYNPADEYVIANGSQAESSNSYNMTDFLGNGFKLRDTQNAMNGTNTYIYIAFAENPFKYTNAR